MGRPDAVYPEGLRDEPECLTCGQPFTPGRKGWRVLYCSAGCWRANNGSSGRPPTPSKPTVAAVNPYMPRAERERREAFVQEVEAAFDQAEAAPPPPPPPPPAVPPVSDIDLNLEAAVATLDARLPHLQPSPPPRLVVVGVERCPRCATDHQIHGYRSRP